MERLKRIGKLEPRHSLDVKESPMGLGMEKLDRDAFDPEKVYDKVAHYRQNLDRKRILHFDFYKKYLTKTGLC